MIKRMLVILMISLAIPAFSSAVALSAPTVSINPPNLDAKTVGEQMTFEVRIAGVKDLYAYECNIEFPAALMKVIKVERSSFLGSVADTLFIAGSIDNSAGKITGVTESKRGKVAGSSGDGSLFKVTIEVKKLNPGDVKFSIVKLAKPDATAIAPVTVVGAGFEKSENPAGETVKDDTPEPPPTTGNTQTGSSAGSTGSDATTQENTPSSPSAVQDTRTVVKSSGQTAVINTGPGSSEAGEGTKTGSADSPDGRVSAPVDTRMSDGSGEHSTLKESRGAKGSESGPVDTAKEKKGFFGRIFSSIGGFFSSIFGWMANLFS